MDKNKIKNDSENIKENKINKRKVNKNDNNILIANYVINILRKFILINIFCKLHNIKQMNLFIFYDSKITLKIKGIGDSIIFGNETGQNFQDINYLKEVYINGNKQNKIEYKYNFNQTLNFVELIGMFIQLIAIICLENVQILLKLIFLILIAHKLHLWNLCFMTVHH